MRLKIPRWKHRAGSTPARGTILIVRKTLNKIPKPARLLA